MSSAEHVYLNGRIVRPGAAGVSPLDRGFLYGDGFFETTRILGGRALLLGRHLDRLAASCLQTGFGAAPNPEELADGVARLIEANGVREGYLRITVTRGPYGGRLTELASESPTAFIQARAMALPPLEAPPALVLARARFPRNERSPLVGHKCLSYLDNVLALAEARRQGADEVYFLNTRGLLAEGAISNLFLVADGAVRTPDVACGLLPGVTRRAVLDLCERLGVPSEEGEYPEECLAEADEVFCTNSLRGVMGVSRVLGAARERPPGGPLVQRLQAAYAEFARESCGLSGAGGSG